MENLLINLSNGIDKKSVDLVKFGDLISKLIELKAIKDDSEIYKIDSRFRVGRINILKSGDGFLESSVDKKSDLKILAKNLMGSKRGDLVLAKRDFYSRGKPSGEVIYIIESQYQYSVGYIKDSSNAIFDVKTDLNITVPIDDRYSSHLRVGTVVKIDNKISQVVEILGNLEDSKVDEKISLSLFDKVETFSSKAILEAQSYGDSIDIEDFKERVDLRDLPFCTIDPPDAKDHDDAIYFDKKNSTLYVAIADVSEYVIDNSALDLESRKRGFTIYFPHKSIPMLPRELSENICSLRENEDRLAHTFKIKVNKTTLEIESYELMLTIIKSRRKYSYDRVDEFLDNKFDNLDDIDRDILEYLIPLYSLTKKLKKDRLRKGFDFHTKEFRLNLNEDLKLLSVDVESETPSHSLIEDCMLLANKCSSIILGDNGIFRTHEAPSISKMDELILSLAQIGISVDSDKNIHNLILTIQKKAKEVGLEEEVDSLIIKSQKQAAYTSTNYGHFGLGFDEYSHFTSPIRRYSDLILHRLLKSITLKDDSKYSSIMDDIDSVCKRVSLLERETQKVAWDYESRVFARWADDNIDKIFTGITVEVDNRVIVELDEVAVGCRIFVKNRLSLFDRVKVKILNVNIATTYINGEVVEIIDV